MEPQVSFLRPGVPVHPEGLNFSQLRTNSLLRRDEQEMIDRAVLDVARGPIGVVNDLRAHGLTVPVGIGTVISTYNKQSDMKDASVGMSMASRAEADRLEFTKASVPVPVISAEFSIEERELAASRAGYGGLDLSHAETATRKVLEKIEEICFDGATVKVEGATLQGFGNFSDRTTGSGATWATASNIELNVRQMIGDAHSDLHYGPYILYLNSAQFIETLVRPSTSMDRISLEVIKALPGLEDVKVSSKATAGEAILVEMTKASIDVVIGQDITVVPWQTEPGIQHWRVLAILAPRLRSDANSRSGIVHYTNI